MYYIEHMLTHFRQHHLDVPIIRARQKKTTGVQKLVSDCFIFHYLFFTILTQEMLFSLVVDYDQTPFDFYPPYKKNMTLCKSALCLLLSV